MDVIQHREQRREKLRRRALAHAYDGELSLNCATRLAAYGDQHEPCRAPHDPDMGVSCLCCCHDPVLAVAAESAAG